jgi:ABC-type sugar transport system permease subunit
MTSGGPGYETTTVNYFIYLNAFVGFDLGVGAALAALIISSVPTILMLIVFSRYLIRGITLGFGQ